MFSFDADRTTVRPGVYLITLGIYYWYMLCGYVEIKITIDISLVENLNL